MSGWKLGKIQNWKVSSLAKDEQRLIPYTVWMEEVRRCFIDEFIRRHFGSGRVCANFVCANINGICCRVQFGHLFPFNEIHLLQLKSLSKFVKLHIWKIPFKAIQFEALEKKSVVLKPLIFRCFQLKLKYFESSISYGWPIHFPVFEQFMACGDYYQNPQQTRKPDYTN